MIDDFHLIGDDQGKATRKALIKRFKAFVEDGDLSILLLTITDKEIAEVINEVPDLKERTDVLAPPVWQFAEMAEIIEKGFCALSLTASDDAKRHLIANSYRNPLLLQVFCQELCFKNRIYETQDTLTELDAGPAVLTDIFSNVAKRREASMQRVRKTRGDALYTMRNKRQATMYELVLLATADIGVMQEISVRRIAEKIREYLPRSSTVTQEETLAAVEELATRLHALNDANLTASYANGSLLILHPLFKLYLRWHLAPSLGHHPKLLNKTDSATTDDYIA